MKIFETKNTNIRQFMGLVEGDVFTTPNVRKPFMKISPHSEFNCVNLENGRMSYLIPTMGVLLYPDAEVHLNATSNS